MNRTRLVSARFNTTKSLPLTSIAILLLLLLPTRLATAAEPTTPAAQGTAAAVKPPQAKVTISKDTTRIMEPLTADGYPDYLEALNRKYSRGVTPENNAVVALWRIMGPNGVSEKIRTEYFARLGIPVPPVKGNYYLSTHEYLEKRRGDKVAQEETNQLYDQFDQAQQRPWTKKEFPLLAEWLAANEHVFVPLAEMSRRAKWYSPQISTQERQRLLTANMEYMSLARDMARLLAVRAMLQLGEGKVDQAMENVVDLVRFGNLVMQGPGLVDALVGIAICSVANEPMAALAQHGKVTAKQASRFRQQVQAVAVTTRFANRLDESERYLGLEAACDIASNGASALRLLAALDPTDKLNERQEAIAKHWNQLPIDGDSLLANTNQWYDRVVAVANSATLAQQKERKNKLDSALKALTRAGDEFQVKIAAMTPNEFPGRAEATQKVGEMMVAIILPATSACLDANARHETSTTLNDLVLALAGYLADHGEYPERLEQLVPAYMAKLPGDAFSGAKFCYQRTKDGFKLYSVGANEKDEGGRWMNDQPAGDDLLREIPQPKRKP